MDQTGAALVEAVEPYGLMPLLFIGAGIALVVVMCAFIFPVWRKNNEAKIDIMRAESQARTELEREREARKAQEAEEQAENNRQRAEIDGRTAVLLEGLKTSIDALVSTQEHVNAQIESSRTSSQKMGSMVEDTNRKVSDLHRSLLS